MSCEREGLATMWTLIRFLPHVDPLWPAVKGNVARLTLEEPSPMQPVMLEEGRAPPEGLAADTGLLSAVDHLGLG